jgi:hypothetical protein
MDATVAPSMRLFKGNPAAGRSGAERHRQIININNKFKTIAFAGSI